MTSAAAAGVSHIRTTKWAAEPSEVRGIGQRPLFAYLFGRLKRATHGAWKAAGERRRSLLQETRMGTPRQAKLNGEPIPP
jgi:hypothetical protein